MKPLIKLSCRIFGFILPIGANAVAAFAQRPRTRRNQAPEPSSEVWFYVTVAAALISLGVVFYFWSKSRKSIEETQAGSGAHQYNRESYETDADAEKEIEWLRKAKKSSSNKSQISYGLKKTETPKEKAAVFGLDSSNDESGTDTKAFQERMKMLQYAQLPINSFKELVTTRNVEMLLDSDAKALTDAIDQTNEDFQSDDNKREAALKTISAFRTANAVEALSQVALYDISAGLRSKAVSILTDFDHETVFETVLLACADPTREVRAAAARGLFRLNFDRSGAWKRIIDTGDAFRMSQAVRAASEAGIVTKSFERLVHEDVKIAYEAFTLVALLIKSGETNEIFTTLRDHKDERIKYAVLHVLKAIKDERAVDGLSDLLQSGICSPEVNVRIGDVIESLERVAAHSHA